MDALHIPAPRIPTEAEKERAYVVLGFDVRSDTVTLPSARMQAAMASAVCGDDMYGTDGPTNELQTLMAQLTGKEAALFMASGTQSNQLALHLHVSHGAFPPGVLCDHRAHVHACELGGLAFHSRATVQPVVPAHAPYLTLPDVAAHAQVEPGSMAARTCVISLENTLHGTIQPLEEIERIAAYARARHIRMHLDGARLWHAVVESGLPLARWCAPFDTVSLCFSKGLGAPIGSILVGTRALIQEARCLRKAFGGGMRQTGVLAAAAHVALHDHLPLLRATHALARRVADEMQACGVRITAPVDTNVVMYDLAAAGWDPAEAVLRASALDPPILLGRRHQCIVA
ncbi:low-specificity L-threonine aldolase [Malassezia nana]|uniref:Low-specificity L-threonine aldolase n=1 Tax=Malassezia nana TaxID=180528 RepID=A0AAF0J185_9BASI|nr:low-specificity L-threonine aldolase [Malassezia nana]